MRYLHCIISLTHLFSSVFGGDTKAFQLTHGLVKKGNGNAVSNESDTFLENPEETGTYFEGDLSAEVSGSEFTNQSLRWPNATIPYVIEGNYSTEHRLMIIQAMFSIQLWTCIKFKPHTFQTDYIAIRSVKNGGCSSFIGRIGGRQVILLEEPLCFAKVGTPLHELLHAIGLFHEHNRPDRDHYITVNKSNVKEGKEGLFKTYNNVKSNNFIDYDYYSIMHFSDHAASKNNRSTIIPKVDGVKIGQRDGLSVGDVTGVNLIYSYNSTIINFLRKKNITSVLPNFKMSIISQLSDESIRTASEGENFANLTSIMSLKLSDFSHH